MVRTLKKLVKSVLSWFNGLVHPLYRKWAHDDLQARAPYGSVIFICLGNVCRSPYAEYSFRRMLPPSVRDAIPIESAGFIGPGRQSPEDAQGVALERSVDLSPHVSRVLTRSMAGRSQLIVVMDPKQRSAIKRQFKNEADTVIVLGDLDPGRPGARRIFDPWGRDRARFRQTFERIDRCLAELRPYLGRRPGF